MELKTLIRHHWHGGQLLAFSGLDGPTDFYQGLTARTAFEAPAIDFMFPGECRVQLSDPEEILMGGDFFQIMTKTEPVIGAFLDAHHFLIEGPCEIHQGSKEIAVVQQGVRHLIGTASRLDAQKIAVDLGAALEARSHWFMQQAVPSGLSEKALQTLAKAYSQMKTQVYSPEGPMKHAWTTPDRWPHRGMWLWDSVFHAIGWRHLDPALARAMLTAVLDIQQPEGFIARANAPRSSSKVTQPPVLALGVERVNAVDPQPEWIAQVYPKLCAYIEWDLAQRDSDGDGLLEWDIEEDINCRSGESGMDNSSRFDASVQLDAVDFNAYLASECGILARFARQLQREEEALRWESRRLKLCGLINARLWSPTDLFYMDYDINRRRQSPVIACTGFLPLICGAVSPERAQILASHLTDPAMFGTPLRVASIAAKDKHHYAKDMWRGPVWININWLIAYGFEQAGLPGMAAGLRKETMAEIESMCARYGTFFEFFDDRREVDPPLLHRKGRCAPEISPYHQVIHDYGWTATLYVDMLLSTGH